MGAEGAGADERHGHPAGPTPAAQPPKPQTFAAWLAEARRVAAQRRKDWKAEKARRWHAAHPPQPLRPSKEERPRCGARTRAGGRCQARALWHPGELAPRNGRCRMHGGLSTGPRTEEGRRRSVEAGARGRETQRRRKLSSHFLAP